jgi:predicted nucleotide-binding protein
MLPNYDFAVLSITSHAIFANFFENFPLCWEVADNPFLPCSPNVFGVQMSGGGICEAGRKIPRLVGRPESEDRPLNLMGDWIAQPHGVHKLSCRDKAGLLWSETKGTIWFDGPPPAKAALEKKVLNAIADGVAKAEAEPGAQIFVVHGRDHASRDQLELILNRLGLTPFVLEVTGGGGDTLIEALERQIGKIGRCKFGIVLATPDDVGFLEEDGPPEAKPRARQNVIMEMGMLLASLTRKNCAILQKGYVELPSNMAGVITIPFNNHLKEAVPKLVQRLQESGFKLDPAAIGRASA